ncbi:hypothetical protein [uncultured Campylobacter sp.]|jgi:hypothetical protein|uniref:hypothetical protein n=1 Tax=uncultured Campylobacter sp. TaxID=218934 RepID=UPI0015AAB291|nr:hypothetical protein [uncultured Campylobacter sp.]
MKKIIYILAACAAFALGANANEAEFVKNLKQSLNDKNAQLISIDKLNSLNGLNLLIVRSGDKKEAFLASDDGKSLVAITEEPKLADAADVALFKMRTQILKDARDAAALELLKSIDPARFAYIESFDKNNPYMTYIVGDPECPYCAEEMKRITKHLRNSNVKLIFAPVHGKSAFIKSALVLKQLKALSPSDQKGAIDVIEKYYNKDAQVSDADVSKAELDAVYADTKTLFSKGVIKSVPYVIKVKK